MKNAEVQSKSQHLNQQTVNHNQWIKQGMCRTRGQGPLGLLRLLFIYIGE